MQVVRAAVGRDRRAASTSLQRNPLYLNPSHEERKPVECNPLIISNNRLRETPGTSTQLMAMVVTVLSWIS